MRIWRDIGPELSLGMYVMAWVIALLFAYMLSR
jgi:hypothetical protein